MCNLTPEQEERVQRLHAQSLVVNTYGGPFSTPRTIRKWRSGYLENDGEWVPPIKAAVQEKLVPDMRAGGVDCIVAGAGSVDDLGMWLREFQTSSKAIVLAETAADVRQAAAEGRVSFILCAGGLGESDPGNLNTILVYHRLGVRIWSLTHSARNLISDGCSERTGAGLSYFGQRVVQELNQQRILIDVSHLSDAGFWDVLELSETPVIATHSNCRAVCNHERNLTDDMIRALADKGGMMALNFFPYYVKAESPTVEDLVDHIDHIRDLVGVQYVGLGPDFCAGRWEWVLAGWSVRGGVNRAGDHPIKPHPYPKGVKDITQMANVTRALVARGYSDAEIEGILGNNFLRVYESVVG